MDNTWVDHPHTLELLKVIVQHDLVPWGCLTEIKSPQEVLVRLKHYPPVELPDYRTKHTSVLLTRDLGLGALSRISTDILTTAIQMGSISKTALVTLSFRHGNLFAFIHPEDLDKTVLISTEVYLGINLQTPCLAWWHLGKLHTHHALYDYAHLDGKVTTLEKLLLSKRFTSVYVGAKEDFKYCDLPF